MNWISFNGLLLGAAVSLGSLPVLGKEGHAVVSKPSAQHQAGSYYSGTRVPYHSSFQGSGKNSNYTRKPPTPRKPAKPRKPPKPRKPVDPRKSTIPRVGSRNR